MKSQTELNLPKPAKLEAWHLVILLNRSTFKRRRTWYISCWIFSQETSALKKNCKLLFYPRSTWEFIWTRWNVSVRSRSNWNLKVLVFEERGKPEYPEKNLSEQRREPTANSTHIWRRRRDLNPGHIGARWALSPLRHPCSPPYLPLAANRCNSGCWINKWNSCLSTVISRLTDTRSTRGTPRYYGQFSLSLEKAPTFSLNSTRLIWTLSIVPSVSVLTWFGLYCKSV